ncbi:hypothetical protein [Bacillus sp. V3B]|uniref:hypothetical protein n=1 Tax=Bacillus sp. V3B TaxID=2804915 RepID=UPI00210998BD|nr:hypothetical protein [Bacillus sp. V3B]
MMSFVQFDEMYEICCGRMEEPEVVFRVRPTIERLEERMKDEIPDTNRWLYAAKDILNEEERELFYV